MPKPTKTPTTVPRDLPAAMDPAFSAAVQHTARELAHCMTTPMGTDRERYLRELVAVTRAAAIGGEYKDAMHGYNLIGRMLNHITDAPNQHLHLHGPTLTDASDGDLVAMLKAGRSAVAPPPGIPTVEETLTELTPEEAEAVLYGR